MCIFIYQAQGTRRIRRRPFDRLRALAGQGAQGKAFKNSLAYGDWKWRNIILWL
jgi:hypothetical protein